MTFKPSSASRIRTPHFMTGSSWSFIGALTLLGHGTDVILEDGLWTRAERAEKFADAHLRGARIVLHVFDEPRNLLWARLQVRRATAPAGAYPMSEEARFGMEGLSAPDGG